MNFADLRAEVQARGFDFETDARIGTWINRVYHRACERYPWPFLKATATGTAPLVISDVRAVDQVSDTTVGVPLTWRDQRTILEMDPTLSTTDTPDYWYLDGSDTIAVYPVNTSDTISVLYTKVPTDLSDDSDTPLFPSRYHYLLVDGAVAHAYEDSDNFEAASAAWTNYFQAIEEACATLMVPNYDNPADVIIRGSIDW